MWQWAAVPVTMLIHLAVDMATTNAPDEAIPYKWRHDMT
jgi:hypothetical protein